MYTIDWARIFSRSASSRLQSEVNTTSTVRSRRVAGTVWYLGLTSFFTDVSSEMVSSILPIYLVSYLHLTPIAFGAIDGLYQGFAAIARLTGGYLADRWRNHKAVASIGYSLSAVCRLALLPAGNVWSLVAATIAADRTGKGIRTAPRDALISLSTPSEDLGYAFGVHRSLDAAGAMLGPLVAFMFIWRLPGNFDLLFAASFGIAVVGVGIILFFVDGAKRTVADSPASIISAFGLLQIGGFRHLCIAGALVSIATVSDSFLFLTLQHQSGFDAAYFPLLYVAVAGVNSAFSVPLGRLADRGGRWRIFVAGQVMLLSVYAILLAPLQGAARFGLAILLLGGYYAATDGVLTAMAAPTLPSNLCGSGLALLATITNTARLLASMLFGIVWQWFGLAQAIMVFTGLLTIGLLAASLTRPLQAPASVAPLA